MSYRTEKKYDTPEQTGKVTLVESDLRITCVPGGVGGGEVKADHYMSAFGEAVKI